jgi:transcriptional regulator with XRE-family HTH domain
VKKKKPSLAETVSRNIRKARLEAGMTQKELADKAGFKVSYVARLETKPQNISLTVLEKLCVALGEDARVLISCSDLSKHSGQALEKLSRALNLLNEIKDTNF